MKYLRSIAYFLGTIAFSIVLLTSAFAGGTTNQGFVENAGQWPEHVWARATFNFGDVIVQKDGILFFLRDKSGAHQHHHGFSDPKDTSSVIHAHVYKMKFRNGTMHKPIGEKPSNFKVNFIGGSTISQSVGELSCYKTLLIENIYPNIDLALHVTTTGIKYDLILKENAKASSIRIDYEGLDDISVDESGSLQLKTSIGIVTEMTPIAFVERSTSTKELVLCNYVIEKGTVRFKTKNISRSRQQKLVIDPELIFATYSGSNGGGNADNWGNTATYDSLGNLYAAGIAFNFGFPVTTGAFQVDFNSVTGTDFYFRINGDPDVAIMKFSPTGNLIYATYLGGGLTEVPTSTIVNNNNELYILGTTSSSGTRGLPFPTTVGAYDNTFNGGSNFYPLGTYAGISYPFGSDLFISRLSADGSSLLSSTFIGGTDNDGLLRHTDVLARNYGDQFRSEILLDSVGDVYIASHTLSNDILDSSKPGYSQIYSGNRDGIVMKLKSDLSEIIWNTYFGGTDLDACYSLQFGLNNLLYVAGGTTSNMTMTGLQKTYSGNVDGFLFSLSKDDGALISSTYLGTTETDQCYLTQTDKEGFVYVLGQCSGDYGVMNAPYSNPGSHQFIHKLSADLNVTQFQTVIGSAKSQGDKVDFVPSAFLVNDCENIFISGWGGEENEFKDIYYRDQFNVLHFLEREGPYYQGGNTYDLPITTSAFQKNTDGSDFYLMVLKKDMEKLLYSTYFGGFNENEHVDGGTSRFDKKGIVYQAVCAGCGGTSNFPVTPGAHSATNNSENCNNAVFKFDLSSLKADFEMDTTKLCGIGPVTFTNTSLGGAAFIWSLGDGTFSSSSTTFKHTYTKPGVYTVRLIAFDEATCIGTDTAEKTLEVFMNPSPEISAHDLNICKGDTAMLSASYNSDYTYTWSPNKFISDTHINNPSVYPLVTSTYVVHVKNNITQCEGIDSVVVTVFNPVRGTLAENITGCQGQPTVRLYNASESSAFDFVWSLGDGNSIQGNSLMQYSYGTSGEYLITVLIKNQYCSIRDTVRIKIPEVKIPNLFTPNNDSHNDKYVIQGMTNNWVLEVYNRWGDLIYTRSPYDQSWDGEGLSDGVYYYLITDPIGNKCKGWVHIIK